MLGGVALSSAWLDCNTMNYPDPIRTRLHEIVWAIKEGDTGIALTIIEALDENLRETAVRGYDERRRSMLLLLDRVGETLGG